MDLKRKRFEDELSQDTPVVKKEKIEGEVAKEGANTVESDANLKIQKIIEETPANSPEASILALLGQGTIYSETTFKQKIQHELRRGGDINTALIEASKHCQFYLVQPLVDLGA